MRNNVFRVLIFFGLIAGLLFFINATADAKVYKWRSCHPMAVGSTGDKTQAKFAELVKQKTNGKIIIDCYASEQLGPWKDMFDNVVRGVQEVGLLPISPEFNPTLQVVYTVYISDSWEDGKRIYAPDGWMFKFLKPIFGKLGITPLGFYFIGMDGFGTTKGPVVLPSDVKKLGIKVRVWSPSVRLFYQEMGAPAVDISFAELYTSLQTGVCHAQDNTPEVTYTQLRDVQKYYVDINHIFEPLAFLINKKLFDGLSPDLKKAIEEAAAEALAWGNKASEESEGSFYKKMEDYGIKVTRLTSDQRAVWKEFGIRSWAKFEKEIGKEAMDFIRANVKK